MSNKVLTLICWIVAAICYFAVYMVCDIQGTWELQLINYLTIFCHGGLICHYIREVFIERD